MNPVLHDWDELNGTLGISYCPFGNNDPTKTSSGTNPTYCYLFQKLLSNLSTYSMFALDLKAPSEPSYVHLGGINTSYQSSIQWTIQPTMNLQMHEFLMKDLRLDCNHNSNNGNDDTNSANAYGNSKNLLSRYGNTWPAGKIAHSKSY